MNAKIILSALLLLAVSLNGNAKKYAGGDISQLPIYEAAGSVYVDADGNTISDFIPFCADNGWNAIRLRLFVNPDNYNQSDKDTNACQDLEMIKALGKRVKDAGMSLLLDFHYSDTWADPAKQWTPKDWETLSNDDLAAQIYDYTKDVLKQLVAAGAAPDIIQTGNEISYGMCWGAYNKTTYKIYPSTASTDAAKWERFANLLKNAGKACREVLPDAKIVIHTERVAQSDVLTAFYDLMDSYGIDYDIIGLSYYSYYHGSFDNLTSTLDKLKTFGKEIMIVEAGYPLYWAMDETTYDYSATYPYNDEGQAAFTSDLITLLNGCEQVTGFFWWLPEYNPYVSNLTGWYNAPLIEPYTGKPTSAFYVIKDFLTDSDTGISLPKADSSAPKTYYNLAGQRLNSPARSGVTISGGKKTVAR